MRLTWRWWWYWLSLFVSSLSIMINERSRKSLNAKRCRKMYIRWKGNCNRLACIFDDRTTNHSIKWNRRQCACVNTRAKHDKKISGMCIIPAMSADCVAGVWYTPYAYMKRTSKQHWNNLSFTLTRNEMDGNGMNLQLQVQHVLCFLDSDMDLYSKRKIRFSIGTWLIFQIETIIECKWAFLFSLFSRNKIHLHFVSSF